MLKVQEITVERKDKNQENVKNNQAEITLSVLINQPIVDREYDFASKSQSWICMPSLSQINSKRQIKNSNPHSKLLNMIVEEFPFKKEIYLSHFQEFLCGEMC